MTDKQENDEAVQHELETYTFDKTMSPGLRTRLIAETDAERLNDHMREGRSDSLLFLAWLRS